ncbi:DUF6527 family protein [Lysobacter solisilvae (ex Woo and Kim 2022)]|uniref:DUF6527 family protein n=1 Tax=Agrilutibacter terrestris TaxID=2865112 RepID=UPI001CEDDEFF
MLTRLKTWIGRRLGPARQESSFVLVYFNERSEAQIGARSDRTVGVFISEGRPKWAYLKCPCGCERQIALNLMTSQRPAWRLSVRSTSDFSVFPSVNATTCGAHFWLTRGRISWAK